LTETRRGGALACLLCALAATTCANLALTATADAHLTPLVWSGNALEPNWSFAHNWAGEAAPPSAEPVALEFPRLPSCLGTCYYGANDLNGLHVESLAIDDGDEYLLEGHEITLGAGGLTAAPAAGSSGPAGDVLALPFALSASQTWSVAGREGGTFGENGAIVFEPIHGPSSALTFQVRNEAELVLANETEVGPATIAGANANQAPIFNGAAVLLGDVNTLDEHSTRLENIFLIGAGALGALSTGHATLDVGSATDPAEGIFADSAEFDAASEVDFQITGPGAAAGEDYSQLLSPGPIALGDATLHVHVSPPSTQAACPTLRRGQTYTFVSAGAALAGSFANAPEGGPELEVEFAKACGQAPRPMRIAYHRAGATQTVTGTVEGAAQEEQEARERREAQEARELHERQEQEAKAHEETLAREQREAREAHERQQLESARASEAAAIRQREEEAAAAAARKRQEEEAAATASRRSAEEAAARSGVLGVKQVFHPLTRAQLLTRALKACRKQARGKRARCEALARRRYGKPARRSKRR
jgi:hypothetical protein